MELKNFLCFKNNLMNYYFFLKRFNIEGSQIHEDSKLLNMVWYRILEALNQPKHAEQQKPQEDNAATSSTAAAVPASQAAAAEQQQSIGDTAAVEISCPFFEMTTFFLSKISIYGDQIHFHDVWRYRKIFLLILYYLRIEFVYQNLKCHLIYWIKKIQITIFFCRCNSNHNNCYCWRRRIASW